MAPGSCCCVARVKSLRFIIVCIVFFILGALSGTKIFSSWNQSVVAKLPKKIILYPSFVHNSVITNVSPAASDCHRLQLLFLVMSTPDNTKELNERKFRNNNMKVGVGSQHRVVW